MRHSTTKLRKGNEPVCAGVPIFNLNYNQICLPIVKCIDSINIYIQHTQTWLLVLKTLMLID